jgi:putative nucleotidyltransferase with HDIG domain
VNGWWGTVMAAAGVVGAGVAANLAGDEISGRVDLLPEAVIWLAAQQVPRPARADARQEWLAELAAILRSAEGLPVTRLVIGMRYAISLARAARAITAEITGAERGLRPLGGWQAAAVGGGGGGLTAVLIFLAGLSAVAFVPALLAVVLLVVCGTVAQSRDQARTGEGMVAVVCQAIEARDSYTLGHCRRVSDRAVLLARELGLRPDRVETVRQAALLHDVGKLGVPANILRKETVLSEEEFATIQQHCVRGLEISRDMGLPGEVVAGIVHHHERVDGTGYPLGLAAGEIPDIARIIAVPDAFDSLTSTRSFRRARAAAEAAGWLRRGAGSQFDPAMVEAFIRVLEREGTLPALQHDGGEAAAC